MSKSIITYDKLIRYSKPDTMDTVFLKIPIFIQ